MRLQCGDITLDLSAPGVMGVLNVTPDSFSDGGQFLDPQTAVEHARAMVAKGAIIIDVGGESSRPGTIGIPLEEELQRVIPVVRSLAALRLHTPISVDTSKPEVMRATIEAGAGMINDIRALRVPGALEAVASTQAAVCLMHMQGEPRNMQIKPMYRDVVREVHDFLAERMQVCLRAGICRERIMVDPGFGFGKTLEHNLTLLAHLEHFTDLGVPLAVGLSRKSMLGQIVRKRLENRLPASLAAATIATLKGAKLIRAHDVGETDDAVRIATAVLEGRLV